MDITRCHLARKVLGEAGAALDSSAIHLARMAVRTFAIDGKLIVVEGLGI